MATTAQNIPTFTFVPRAKTTAKTADDIDLNKIPNWVKEHCEDVYKTLQTNPGAMYVKFETLSELNSFITNAKAYCAQRPGGAVKFWKSPVKGLEPTEMQFTIKDFNKEAEDIRAAVQAVKDAQ